MTLTPLRLFDPAPGPRVFAVPPGADFAAAFADGLATRLAPHGPIAALSVEVVVHNRRALQAIEAALADRAGGATVLPRLTLVEEVTAPGRAGITALDPLTRHLALLRLVEAYLDTAPGRAPRAAAPDLAASVAELLDLMDEEGVAPDALDRAVAPEMASHWQEALDFLSIARDAWPDARAEIAPGAQDPQAARRRAAERLLATWSADPPTSPLIVAGSTGSRAVTAMLMAAVARLPQGALVLPGLDTAADPAIAAAAGDDHPLGPFRRLFASLDLGPRDLRPWTSLDRDRPRRARGHLLAEALRPAPVTDAWVASRETLGTQAPAATQGLALLEAPTQRIEAAAIALAVREALETPGRTVAVVTRDATLARRVGAALERHGVLPDDSLGQPLAQTPAAVLAAHCLAVARGGAAADPVAIASLLGHPLVCLGRSRTAHRRLARAYERAVLRRRGVAARAGPLPGWPDHAAPTEAEDAWLSDTRAALAPLTKALTAPVPLLALVQAHRDALGALMAGEDATPSSPDLDALDRVFERLALAAPAHAGQVQPAEYAALLDGLLRAETLRAEGARPHPRVFLWGTIEARAGTADLTILAGLNEGSWPGVADTGPWLSRPMRRALGLPSPEREIGLSAHDFLQAAARPDVLLTRSTTVEGVPQLASRWLVRLETLLAGTAPDALEAMRARGRRFGDLVAVLDRADPTDPALAPAPRPCPAPPVALRPRQLSVTAIETLIRDPYAVYARHVLGLRPLEPLGAALDARDRGEAFHEVMRDFVEQTADGLPDFEDAVMLLHDLATQAMAERDVPADLAALWTARFGSVTDRLVAMETELRLRAQPAAQERQGRISVPAPAGPIDLTARADRIDLGDTGGFIYDYKTGQPPSRKQIGRFNHQLHLQGLILAEGGFEDLGAATPIDGAYIGLANAKAVAPQDPLSDALEPYRERLLRLLASYDDPTRGYLSRQVPLRRDDEGDYDHLARRSEWDGRDDDDAGAAS